MEAVFCRGHNIQTMNHTPVGAIATGEVVVVGDIPAVCIRPIAAGELGSLNISGGSYMVAGDAAIAVGIPVYWNTTANKVTATASTHKWFGIAAEACTGDTVVFEVAHRPGGKT
jgi:predicted RecA/RadA family phage recombinase